MTNYCTLAEVKAELKATTTTDDSDVRRSMRQVSARIDALMGTPRRPFFAPYTEQRKFPIISTRIDSFYNVYWLRQHILSVSAVTRGSDTLTANVELYSNNSSVAQGLHLTSTGISWYSDETLPQFIQVTGVWGWHEDYTNAYAHVDDLAADVATTTATSITVADADGADLDGFTPRFSPGNLIQVGSELMEVTAVNTSTNILTVKRGVNGTTAATHTTGDDVNVYQVDERVKRIAARQTGLLYARRGAYQVETLDGVGVITYPQDLLTELRNSLTEFLYE